MLPIKQGITQLIKTTIADNRVVVFSKTWCPFSQKAKKLFDDSNIPYHLIELDKQHNGADIQQALADLTGQKTVPNIFINNTHIGGYIDLRKAFPSYKSNTMLKETKSVNKTSAL
ncbi:glutaredoxin [Lichtheimia hyalospora FSU 10163]|nr:glutaredoxin [Lichtheimia hyalospora FSU 10163]